MKTLNLNIALVALSFFTVSTASAHDPSKHQKSLEKPKCGAMAEMDHSKMDMDDPVMLAMMKKCQASHDSQIKESASEHHSVDLESDEGDESHSSDDD